MGGAIPRDAWREGEREYLSHASEHGYSCKPNVARCITVDTLMNTLTPLH